jgi:hypothetical protein
MMTHCLRPILLGGVLLMASACASEDYNTWASHNTHYASGKHMGFSARHIGATRAKVTADDVAAAQKEQWWGRGVMGLLAGGPPAAVSGQWRGTWVGRGLSNVERGSVVLAEFQTDADGYGRGWIAVADSMAIDGIPWSLRKAGSMGVPVWVRVDGNSVMIREAQVPGSFDHRFSAEFAAQGDRMVGVFRHQPAAAQMTLARVP